MLDNLKKRLDISLRNWYNNSVEFKSGNRLTSMNCTLIYYEQVKMTDTQRCETVQEYLERGGKITKLGQTSAAPDGLYFEVPMEQQVLRAVSWRQLENEADHDDIDDPQYWNKLNKKLDAALKKYNKLGEQSEPIMTEESPLPTVPEHVEKVKRGRLSGIAGGKHHRVGKK